MALNHNVYSGMTLKALLENPDLQRAPAALSGAYTSKAKKGNDGITGGEIDFSSAFLGPNLWTKNSDSGDFNLEYMDLDEFLCENGIPLVETPGLDDLVNSPVPSPSASPSLPSDLQIGSSLGGSQSLSLSVPQSPAVMTVSALSPGSVMLPNNFIIKTEEAVAAKQEVRANSPSGSSPVSPAPVKVEFMLTEQDIALASVPGQDAFNPAAHTFTEDELKPQPMIKKSKKVFVPDDMKDDRYWARRRKNNYAAKRSRDARRVKENQISIRAAYLEKENTTLKEEMEKVRRENVHLKHRLSKYESTNSGTP